MSQQTVSMPGVMVAGLAAPEHSSSKLKLAAQVERLEFQAEQLNEMLGETIATVLMNLEKGYLCTSSSKAEKILRAFLDSRSKRREQLMGTLLA
jgi:hypothetical protein